jgi:HPt (histidine-containing phosphotransfer) domain-containing protein
VEESLTLIPENDMEQTSELKVKAEEEEPLSLISTEESLSDIFADEESEVVFKVNIEENASQLHLSMDEYRELLKDFISNARIMRKELESGDPEKVQLTLSILKDSITLLRLFPLDKELETAVRLKDEEKSRMLGRFYKTLDGLIIQSEKSGETSGERKTTVSPAESTMQKNETQTTPIESLLEDVEPVPIQFSIHFAAEELNLPEDLVLEFINDFASQGREYLPRLIEASKNRDLDQVQKTAHMLKGAASNLRIEPMVKNLKDLQFDNDIDKAADRIRIFAGQLISLEKYLKQINPPKEG